MRGLKLAGIGGYVAPLGVNGATPDISFNIQQKSMNCGVMTADRFFQCKALAGP
jgi:hypothetical protein